MEQENKICLFEEEIARNQASMKDTIREEVAK